MSKSTPGPWELREDTWEVSRPGMSDLVLTSPNKITALALIYRDDSQDEATARLIEAAPDLLEALKDLFRAIQGDPAEMYRLDAEFHGACSAALQKANLAIAKAEGRDE